jgi:Zn-dependent M28 family amino/carboxypeptidase
MQTAQLLQQLHLHPKRTIRVIAWMNEENGGAGGKTYAKDHAADVANHIAAIESDNGAGHPEGYKVNAPASAIQKLRRLALIMQSIGAGALHPLEDIEADITPLQRLGVPTFGLLQDSRTYFNYHHTAADTLDKVEPRLLQENAAAMAMLAYTIANLPEPLARNSPTQ